MERAKAITSPTDTQAKKRIRSAVGNRVFQLSNPTENAASKSNRIAPPKSQVDTFEASDLDSIAISGFSGVAEFFIGSFHLDVESIRFPDDG